jgi:O-antigen ligase
MTSASGQLPWKRLLNLIQQVAWALFLITLPVTSFPYLPHVIGGTALVRPLSIYPLIVLLIIATLPRLFSGPVPRTIYTFLPFVLIALIASLLSLLKGIEPMLGVTVSDRILRALMTLGIGSAIYLTVAVLPRTPDELRSSLRWLYVGFIAALTWGTFQVVYVIHFNPDYFHLLMKLQAFISTRKIFFNRVSGMTYEPNWFAEQISFLLIPWLLASVLSGYSAFRWRWRWLTVEWFLLAWSIVILVFTFSRAGLINLVLLLFLGVVFFRVRKPHKAAKPHTRLASWARRLLEAALVVSIFAGLVFAASTRNDFFARIWGYWRDVQERTVADYFNYLGFGARFMYAEAAYNTYTANPVLGVGLGNYAFYFEEMLPDEFLARTPEILRILTPEVGRSRLITPKNLYFRILAETGLLGMATFTAFLVAVLGCAFFLWLSREQQPRFWGIASLLGLCVFLPAGFSFDSLAIPNMWVVFGLITAAAWVYARQEEPATDLPSDPILIKG